MIGQIVRLLVICFVVGIVLTACDITPANLFHHTAETIHEIVDLVTGFVGWAAPYVMLGAVVVVPVAILMLVLRRRTR